MKWTQEVIELSPRQRGFHIVTDEILSAIPGLQDYRTGMAHIMVLHTSAGITLNENADPDVRVDFSTVFNSLVPEGDSRYVHTLEGPDDMPAHIKSSIVGSSVLVPVRNGRLLLGTWQGIYLCEFRDRGGARRVAVTVWGDVGASA